MQLSFFILVREGAKYYFYFFFCLIRLAALLIFLRMTIVFRKNNYSLPCVQL